MAPKLVVIGAGFAGAKVAKLAAASRLFDVTVIEPKDFMEISYGAVRTIVSPGAFKDGQYVQYKGIQGGLGRLVPGRVARVMKHSVVLESGEELPFDYAVIATGSTHNGAGVITPGKNTSSMEARKVEVDAAAAAIKAAKAVVVVGGGPVGIEVVGEILEAYAGKKVTLITSGAQLLDGKDKKAHDYLSAAITKHGGKVILNDKADKWDEASKVLTTKNGTQVPADYVIWATGSKPNTQILDGGDLAGTLDAAGRIKVDQFLRVKGFQHVFALGDVNDTPQAKLGFLADMQADATAANLACLVAGKPPKVKWTPPMEPKGVMMVSFGRGDGLLQAGGCVCTGGLLGGLKGKELNVPRARGALGAQK